MQQIDVCVKEPKVTEQFVVYNIQGSDKEGPFANIHRFNDFVQLRSQLCDQWNYCYIPSLPPKIIQGNFQEETIIQRMQMLDFFMRSLSYFEFLWYSNVVQEFLRPDKIKPSQINQDPSFYCDILVSTFPQYVEQNIDYQNEARIEQFSLFLINAKPLLLRFKEILKQKLLQHEKFCDQMIIFKEFFIPEYEVQFQIKAPVQLYRSSSKIYQYQNQEKQLFSPKQDEFHQFYIQLKIEMNEYDVLLNIIEKRKQLSQEIESLRSQLENQVQTVASLQNGGLNIFKKYFIQKEKETENQLFKLKQLEQEVIRKQQIYLVISNKFASEIGYFKANLTKNYYQTIREMSQIFTKNSRDNYQFYNNLLKECNNWGT